MDIEFRKIKMSTKSIQQADLDVFVEDYNRWHEFMDEVIKEKDVLAEQLKISEKERNDYISIAKAGSVEMGKMQLMITQIQETIDNGCDLNDENRTLKQTISDLNVNMLETATKTEQEFLLSAQQMRDQKLKNDQELAEQINAIKMKGVEEQTNLKKTIEEKTMVLEKLRKQIMDMEKEKQTELMKLKVEYDGKLLSYQRMSTKTQHPPQMSYAHQDIFRKKLLHAKAESDGEIAKLRATISDLRKEVAPQGHKEQRSVIQGLGKRKRLG